MRPAVTERVEAEDKLEAAGWILVSLPREARIEEQFISMLAWCGEYIGNGRVEIEAGRINPEERWYSYSWYGYWNFWFQHEKDATLFALRWK